jgi:long-chain fatty acid transport protein
MKHLLSKLGLLLAIASLIGAPLLATDGYFATGYGIKEQGQGGAGIALPGDSLGAAINPAEFAVIGNRFDFGFSLFRPIRGGTITYNQLPSGYPDANGAYDANRRTIFPIPELGYNRQLRHGASLGVSVFGNGGMNTSYRTAIPLLGITRGGVDLQQLFVAPTLALKLNKHYAVGIALNVAYQRFAAEGLQNFATASLSSSPGNVTNRGYDNSFGAGVRGGWLGSINRVLSLGATFQTKTYMSKLGRYRGLFAEQGGFDIPANFGGGAALHLNPNVTVLFDAERILYGQVKSIANPGSNQALLGANNGPGFGWRDTTAEKTGISYQWKPALTFRGGYNHSGLPFSNTQTFFNLLAPAVVEHHVHMGTTVGLKSGKEINLAYVHAFGNTLNGVSSIPPTAGGGNANLRMHQDSIAIGFGWSRE